MRYSGLKCQVETRKLFRGGRTNDKKKIHSKHRFWPGIYLLLTTLYLVHAKKDGSNSRKQRGRIMLRNANFRIPRRA